MARSAGLRIRRPRPVADERAVADAIAASAPGLPVLRVRPAEALARTRPPYVPGRRCDGPGR